MDRDNAWSNHKNESSKTVEQCSPYFCNISANTNPAYYNVLPHHYGSPEFPSYHNYLAKPCHGHMNACYNHGYAMGDGNPFLCAQPCNVAMERKNCSKMQPKDVHAKGCSIRSNRNKKLNSENNKNHFTRRPQFMNYINTENNNQQMIFDTRANIYNAIPESQMLLTGDVGNRNNALLNESTFTEKNLQYSSLGTNQTNLQYSSASEHQTNSSINFNMNDALLMAASGTNTHGFHYDTGASIYLQEENITNFANENSRASNQFNDFDTVLTKSIPGVDSMQPLDQTQLLDTSKENFLLNATNIFNAGSNQTNLEHSSASENQINSTNFNMNDDLLMAASGTNTHSFNFDPAASIYFQEENITNFPNEDSSASNQFINDFDNLLTKCIPGDDSMQPLDQSQLLDASKENSLLNAQKTTTLVSVDEDGKEQIFNLATLCEGKDESGKEVILLLAAPEVQQQIAQGNGSVGRTVGTQRVQSAENASTGTTERTAENTVVGHENDLQSVPNEAAKNFQEVENMDDDSNTIFTSNIDKYFGREEVVKTSRRKKRKHQIASANMQTQCKKFNKNYSEGETTGSEGLRQRNLDERHSCQSRCRRANSNCQSWRDSFKWNSQSYKTLQNQYFWKFATKYFEENHINDTAQQKDMRAVLNKVGGSAMKSIWCFFEIWKMNYNARRHNYVCFEDCF